MQRRIKSIAWPFPLEPWTSSGSPGCGALDDRCAARPQATQPAPGYSQEHKGSWLKETPTRDTPGTGEPSQPEAQLSPLTYALVPSAKPSHIFPAKPAVKLCSWCFFSDTQNGASGFPNLPSPALPAPAASPSCFELPQQRDDTSPSQARGDQNLVHRCNHMIRWLH